MLFSLSDICKVDIVKKDHFFHDYGVIDLMVQVQLVAVITGKGKKGKPLMEKLHDTATECHLPYGITQCYLLPITSEHTAPSTQPDRLVLDLPTI